MAWFWCIICILGMIDMFSAQCPDTSDISSWMFLSSMKDVFGFSTLQHFNALPTLACYGRLSRLAYSRILFERSVTSKRCMTMPRCSDQCWFITVIRVSSGESLEMWNQLRPLQSLKRRRRKLPQADKSFHDEKDPCKEIRQATQRSQ